MSSPASLTITLLFTILVLACSGNDLATNDDGGGDASLDAPASRDASLADALPPTDANDGASDADARESSAPDADAHVDASDAADAIANDASDAGDASDAHDAIDANDASDASDASDSSDAPDTYVPPTTINIVDLGLDGGAITIDPTFGSGGIFTPPASTFGDAGAFGRAYIVSLAVRADGRIVALGSGDTGEIVLQALADGSSLDPTFGAGLGFVRLPQGFDHQFNSVGKKVAIQSDGKIVVGGICPPAADAGIQWEACVVRLESDGALDTAYGAGGTTRIVGLGQDTFGYSISVDAQDRALLTGAESDVNADERLFVERFVTNGSPDTTFNGTGFAAFHLSGHDSNFDDEGVDIAVQSNGRIVVLGQHLHVRPQTVVDFIVVGFTETGAFDTTFAVGSGSDPGSCSIDFGGDDHPSAMAPGADDSLVVVGTTSADWDQRPDLAAAKLTSSGALDPTFATSGKAVWVGSTGEHLLTSVVARLGSAYYVASLVDDYNDGTPLVFKILSNGTLDPTYGSGGVGHLPFKNGLPSFVVGSGAGRLFAGSAIVLGNSQEAFGIERLQP